MTFEIWLGRDEGAAVLTAPLPERDRTHLQERNFYHHADIEAASYTGAQDSFIAWCQTRLPGATEELVDEKRMRLAWFQLAG